ncbi:MAG: stage 0 sporulation family protein [Lachnospiraceae bacterium]|nr:stage 0 sporulation family protein [Lachnospiraceae bacterium]
MSHIIGVRFREGGKSYFFTPGAHQVRRGTHVIVETSRGTEFGTVVYDLGEDSAVQHGQVKEILRIATPEDEAKAAENREKEKKAYGIGLEKIAARGLEMKLIDVEYTFDNNKLLFYFTADGRVDFRELVKDLAGVFRTRIELRQIGVRDETKMLGGMGICGRALCCHAYLTDFNPVSIKMAKEQGLSLNPTKISGVCGRLMCCLNNEEEVYEEINSRMPAVGDTVTAADGVRGEVSSVNILRETMRVFVEAGDEREVHEYPLSEIKEIERRRKQKNKPSQGGGKNKKKSKEEAHSEKAAAKAEKES